MLEQNSRNYKFLIPLNLTNLGKLDKFICFIDNLVSPLSVVINSDKRKLDFGFESMVIQ